MNQTCPYCREKIRREEAQLCPSCRTPHHHDCYAENGGCTVFGCEQAPGDEAKIIMDRNDLDPVPGRFHAGNAAGSYLVAKGGQQFGPFTEAQIRLYLAEKRLGPEDLAWSPGMTQWAPISQVLGETDAVPPPAGRDRQIDKPTHTIDNQSFHPPMNSPNLNPQNIPNYLWQSIVVTVLCCLPFGIPAIIYASKVNNALLQGDTQAAQRASSAAGTWCLVSLIAAVVFWILYAGVMVLMVSASA